MKPITYLTGDALNPVEVTGRKFIVHCCNNVRKFGAGIALSIRNKWPIVYDKFMEGPEKTFDFQLGDVQFVKVKEDIVVTNMIGQEGVGMKNGIPPIRYDAIDSCLKKVAKVCKKYDGSVVGPRFGAGLAGGDWKEIEKLIIKNLCEQDIPVYIYDL